MAKENLKVNSSKRPLISELSAQLGKLPPQAVEVEEVVLGALMLEKKIINVVADILAPESFYKESHKLMYEAIITLYNNSEPIDIKTVTHQLRKMGKLDIVGGAYYISQCTSKVNSAANTEVHAKIIQEQALKRELIRLSTEIQHDAYEDTEDVHKLFDKVGFELSIIARNMYAKNYQHISGFVPEVIDDADKASKTPSGVTGVPTGFEVVDKHTAGWQPADLIIIAARPGMGKTGFVLSATRYAASVGFPTAIFSLEMPSKQLTKRLISQESEVDLHKFKSGKFQDWEWEKILHRGGEISNLPIYIDDTPAITLLELRAKSRRLVDEHGVKQIIIDYLQLMSGSGNSRNREQEIAEISRGLKALAKELNVPIIALSQLSRGVESRGGAKRPQLQDLRESGSIEQDADCVIFLYRPEYYGIDQDENGMPTKGIGEAIVAKMRDGGLDDLELRFISRFAQWANKEGVQMKIESCDNTDFTITLPSKNQLFDDQNEPF